MRVLLDVCRKSSTAEIGNTPDVVIHRGCGTISLNDTR